MNTEEFQRYKQLEAKHAQAYTLSPDVTLVVKLPGHLPITVHASSDVRATKYDFVWTRFGVVKLLSDDGKTIYKSQLCYQLDEAMWRDVQPMPGTASNASKPTEDEVLKIVRHSIQTQPIRTNAVADNPTKRGLL